MTILDNAARWSQKFGTFMPLYHEAVNTYTEAAVEFAMIIFESLQCFRLCKVLTKRPARQEMSTRRCADIENSVLDGICLLAQIVSDRPRLEVTRRRSFLGLSSWCTFEEYPYLQEGLGVISSLTDGSSLSGSVGCLSMLSHLHPPLYRSWKVTFGANGPVASRLLRSFRAHATYSTSSTAGICLGGYDTTSLVVHNVQLGTTESTPSQAAL